MSATLGAATLEAAAWPLGTLSQHPPNPTPRVGCTNLHSE